MGGNSLPGPSLGIGGPSRGSAGRASSSNRASSSSKESKAGSSNSRVKQLEEYGNDKGTAQYLADQAEMNASSTMSQTTKNVPNGNSKGSTKPQHGYEISEKATGDVAKTGISGQPLNKNGTSPRTNSQVNKWNKEAGYDKYEGNVVNPNIPNRQDALQWERQNAQRLWDEGNSMNRHQRPRPWEE